MRKLFIPFGLYWHNLLDILLTHVFVIGFLQTEHALIASFFMSMDALIKVILAIPIAHCISRMSAYWRGRISFLIRLFLLLLWFLTITYFNFAEISYFILFLFIIFKLLMALDVALSADFIFNLQKNFQIDLSQVIAAQNIFIRGSVALAPSVALFLLKWSYGKNIIFAVILCWVVSTINSFKKMYFPEASQKIHNISHNVSLFDLLKNPLIRWGFAYQILANIAFAGVSFLFLALLKLHANLFFNEITCLYSAFFILQLFTLIYGDRFIPILTTKGVSYVMMICGLLVLLVGMSHPGLLRLMLCFGIGMTYSISISAISIVLTAKLQGQGFITFSGWAQTLGRFSSCLITTVWGLVVSAGYQPTLLLVFCGVIGVMASISLALMGSGDKVV